MDSIKLIEKVALDAAKQLLQDDLHVKLLQQQSRHTMEFIKRIEYCLYDNEHEDKLDSYLFQKLRKEAPQKKNGHVNGKCTTNIQKKRANTSNDDPNIAKKRLTTNKPKDIDLLNKFDNKAFENFLHMNKMSFLKIFQFIRKFLISHPWPPNIVPQSIFSLSLWKLTTNESFEVMSQRFGILTSGYMCVLIKRFWHVMSDSYTAYIKWPNSQLSQKLQMQAFEKHPHLKIFPKLFGIAGIKRLVVFLTMENAEIPIILQIICNADQKIVDCFIAKEQEYKFENSPVGRILNINPNAMPKESYIIGDKQFPLTSYMIRPFSTPKGRQENKFNRLLTSASSLVYDTMNIMAKRFNALYALKAHDLIEVRKIVETICSLHNLSMTIEDDYVDRKRRDKNFNWSNNNANSTIVLPQGSENNESGIQKRKRLAQILLKNN